MGPLVKNQSSDQSYSLVGVPLFLFNWASGSSLQKWVGCSRAETRMGKWAQEWMLPYVLNSGCLACLTGMEAGSGDTGPSWQQWWASPTPKPSNASLPMGKLDGQAPQIPYLELGFWGSVPPCKSGHWDPIVFFLVPPGCSGLPDWEPETLFTMKDTDFVSPHSSTKQGKYRQSCSLSSVSRYREQ